MTRERRLVTLDYETHGIEHRPVYPPEPVGVAICGDGVKTEYLAWGHPDKNNCDVKLALHKLRDLHRDPNVEIIYHNCAFDTDVSETHLQLPTLPWNRVHDTLFLAFLHDPRAEELSLKPLAAKLLGMPPAERDAVRDWVLENVPEATPKTWGAFISRAPGDLVGKYAVGDVVRTHKLYKLLVKELRARDRQYPSDNGQDSFSAYDRERKLMPILRRMEAVGIKINKKRLARELPTWQAQADQLERYIISKLGGVRAVRQFANDDEPFNVGSGKQLAAALEARGLVTEWLYTAKGNKSVAAKALSQGITDKKLVAALQKREILLKYISTYGQKWLDAPGERVYPRINQVRNRENDASGMKGARTGRLSYSDSWQAIPAPDRRPFDDLPNLRDYVIPDEPGHMFCVRDYSQQEFRILAHYENGPLLARYQADPKIDMHHAAREMINELTGIMFDRRPVKDTGFGLIYGMGLEKTAEKTRQDLKTAKLLRDSYLKAIPGLPALIRGIKQRCRRGEPIRTWGGRLYWVEEPKIIKGVMRSFDYKMINVLIQGSAGDCTKEGMINADEPVRAAGGRVITQVHDELGMSAPVTKHKRAMRELKNAMESVPFDVKMLTDGKISRTSWGSLKEYKDEK